MRWAVLTLALAAAVGVSAYWTALASRPVERQEPDRAQPGPSLLPLGDVYAGARREGVLAARDSAYVRGRRAGLREGRRAALRRLARDYRPGGPAWKRIYGRGRLAGLGGFGRWSPGASYVVTAAPDGRGITARAGPLVPGARYELCRDGKRVCVRRPG